MEDRGLIEARPQSGYYVRPHFSGAKEPETTAPACMPVPVDNADLAMRVLRDTMDPRMLQFGAAIPNPDLLPLDRINRRLAAAARGERKLGGSYDLPPGYEPLRVQIARRALTAGCTLTPDEIVTTLGGQEAVNLCLRAVCSPGDTVAIESPVFYGILQAIESLGLRALEIATHPRDGMEPEALRAALDRHDVRACLVISNFNNPLGSCIPDENKKTIVELLAERDVPLIEDDVYGELSHTNTRPKVAKAFDTTGGVMLCSSFSKTIAPGYRVGWAAPGRYMRRVTYLKMMSNLANPTLTQVAVAELLADGGFDHNVRRLRRAYAKQTASMASAICRTFPEGTRFTRPAGGFVLWVELPTYVDSIELYRQAARESITLAPGPLFSAQGGYGNFIRLNSAFWSEKHEGKLEVIGRLAAAMKKK
jgi:DNA-binding transcriptional MocR family regulator